MSNTTTQANAHTNFSPPAPAPGRASSRPKQWLTAIAISALALSTVVMDAETAAATGTPADCFTGTTEPSTAPTQDGIVYQIASKENLVWVSWATSASNTGTAPIRADALGASYQQTANVDLEGCNWTPIGDFSSQFMGQFDGGGYTIIGLTIEASTPNDQGLLGATSSSAKLLNIGLVDVSVTAGNNVGGLVGRNGGIIENSYATGVVTGAGYPGGLAGRNIGTITNSYSTGAVTGQYGVGGLVGYNLSAGTIQNSYATGDVIGDVDDDSDENAGGLVGENNGAITNSYATGDVTGYDYVGGLVGYHASGATITNSYATGRSTEGGLVGGKHITATATNSFWDTETSGQPTSAGGTGKSTADMKAIDTFTDVSPAWAIVSTWEAFSAPEKVWGISPAVNSGYPYLLWQLSPVPNASPVFTSGTTGSGVAGTASSVYTAVASDADGDAVTYSLGSAVQGFTINSSTGVVSMAASVAAGSHVLTVVASDGTASATQTVTVTVSAASAPSADAGLALDRSVGQPIAGAGVDYFVDGLQVGSTWTLTLRSTPQIIASGIVDGSGSVRGTAVIPAGLSAGWHSITMTGTNILGTAVNEVLWFELNEGGVVAAKQDTAPTSPAAVLARTGSDIGGLLTGALMLLMLGLVAVAFTRRQEKGLLAD